MVLRVGGIRRSKSRKVGRIVPLRLLHKDV